MMWAEEIEQAISLALEFKRFCIKHNFPRSAEICGVAWDAQHIREQAYIDRKNVERAEVVYEGPQKSRHPERH